MSSYTKYDSIRDELNLVRRLQESVLTERHSDMLLTEDVNNKNYNTDAVPYSKQDELYNSIVETCKTQFGADFSKINSPMLYFPSGEDIKVSGLIPLMNDAKFQFSFKDSEGCQIWVDPLKLNDETLDKMRMILGVYKNWKKEVQSYGDYKPISLQQNNHQEEPQDTQLQPGDDAELAN